MICISIAQESRRLVLADMLNASRQCDLLEVQMDRFTSAPDVGELLANKPKPMILSCRRPADGGWWQGSEDERLAILRQCLVSKADYVEIELDAADQVRALPPAKRVIAYTNLKETPPDIADIYAEALSKKPDVVKLVTRARTPEEAWPLVQLLVKPKVPTVVIGLGKPGLMLTVLGKKIGAPWTYAALERGMEAYPEQPTVQDLKEVYHYSAIEKTTRFLAVTGFSEREHVLAALLNAGLARLGESKRCLPLQIGDMRLFRKLMDIVKLKGVVVDEPNQQAILEVATVVEPAAQRVACADLVLHQENAWHGYNLFWRATGAALEAVLRVKTPGDKPLQNRVVLIVGGNATARTLTLGIKSRGGIPIVASRDRNRAQQIAQETGCRCILFEAVYSTSHDVLVVCGEEKNPGKPAEAGVHPGCLKPGAPVMDLTCMPRLSPLLREARDRGCPVVSPRQVLIEQVCLILFMLTNKQIDRAVLEEVLNERLPEEE